MIAGPCSVETREQTIETAKRVKAAGAHMLRGGAYKPRTIPYASQGLGEKGLEILAGLATSPRPASRHRGDRGRCLRSG